MSVQSCSRSFTVVLLTYCLAPMAPAAAADNLCKPSGKEGAIALPEKLAHRQPAGGTRVHDCQRRAVEFGEHRRAGLAHAADADRRDPAGSAPDQLPEHRGAVTPVIDNELLRAIAAKLGLNVDFAGTEFSGLLAQVATRRFDVGSSSIIATEARRRTVGFTNGYDFGYLSLDRAVRLADRRLRQTGCGAADRRRAGHRQEAYVVDTCMCSR